MATASVLNPSTLNPADIAGAISSYYGVSSGDAAVGKLLEVIFPDIQSATARDAVSWKSVFPTVLAKYERMAKDLGLGISPQQREIDAARNANPTAAGWAGSHFGKLAGLHHVTTPLAMRDDGEGGSSTSERVTAATLSRSAPLSVDGAIGYARELGMNPALAGFFVGTSSEMRDALRGALRNGTSITDDQVKNPNDMTAVLGAIRAGKMKPDDPRVPPSVRLIIEDMKAQGIDPSTAKPEAIKKYLKDNPSALQTAKDANAKAVSGQATLTDEQKLGLIKSSPASAARSKQGGGNAPKKSESTLGI